jgi:transposase
VHANRCLREQRRKGFAIIRAVRRCRRNCRGSSGCTAEQCVCGGCGRETTVIGYEESEQLDVEPAKYFVVVTSEKRACKSCEERGVLAAPLPPRIIEKSLVSDRMVVDTVVSKYADHCPLYRQSTMLERESGVELSRQTLDGWVMRVGELLVPLAEALRQELLRGSYLQADETPVGVQMHDGNGSNHLAYLWQYGQPHGAAVFDFRWGVGAKARNTFGEFRWPFAKRWIIWIEADPARGRRNLILSEPNILLEIGIQF